MKFTRVILFAFFIFSFTPLTNAQTAGKKIVPQNSTLSNQAAKSSPAYAEILLLKTELESQLEDFSADYTDDFPKAKELRYQLDLLQKETNRLFAVNTADVDKLSVALGKLIVRKIDIETNLWSLRIKYKDDYPEVKRAKRKLEVFERAIKEILP